jgi:NAD(P)H-hydrate epimerase
LCHKRLLYYVNYRFTKRQKVISANSKNLFYNSHMIKYTLQLPNSQQHKGRNGRLLLIGGSHLFHAASLWSANIAAHLVDMVFYASTSDNNDLIKFAKSSFRDGIVIERSETDAYADQADVILLGPGLMRGEARPERLQQLSRSDIGPTPEEWQTDTYIITNYLLQRYPEKKFVLDAGSLQLVEPRLLTPACILTPHQREWEWLTSRALDKAAQSQLHQTTILQKNLIDKVLHQGQLVAEIAGGNGGLTKGGSGDALAGLVAGLYCYNDAPTACYFASRTIKTAAETLYQDLGPFFTTTQLVECLPPTLWHLARQPESN